MRVILLLLVLCTAIFPATGQPADFTNSTTSCDADFSLAVDPVNPMIIHFQDQSSGHITLWQWNFGDGSTTTNQNPVHTYTAGGTYSVCLTVSSSDSGYICHDVLCMAITIHEPGVCVADYKYTIDPVEPFNVHFTDQSSGNINAWHWDFGNGHTSDIRNPSYTFPSFGKFRVCLTAYNTDSISTCNDIKCDSVVIAPAVVCHAVFASKLDSLNKVPNTFMFTNASTGEPNKYLWRFDDGATYNTRDVSHHFQSIGQHTVCLVIRKEVHGTIVCTDSVCQTITTAKYFDLGGHLFIGAFPINNPLPTGDTGIAFLFRMDGSRLIPVDTSSFEHMGYYAFPKILNGSYMVRTALTPGSVHYAKYFPAYHQQALFWKDAHTLHLADSNAYVSDIYLTPVSDVQAGPGIIKGEVVKASSKDTFEKLPFAEVILFDAQLKPVLFTFSGDSGQFELNNLPYGAYYAYVEYPGKYSRMTAIWLDSVAPVIDSLHLEVFDHDVTSVPETFANTVITGDLFPNPARDNVNFTLDLQEATRLRFEVRTLTGQTLWSGSHEYSAGSRLVTIPVTSIRAGMYLLLIVRKDGSLIAVKKLLRY